MLTPWRFEDNRLLIFAGHLTYEVSYLYDKYMPNTIINNRIKTFC